MMTYHQQNDYHQKLRFVGPVQVFNENANLPCCKRTKLDKENLERNNYVDNIETSCDRSPLRNIKRFVNNVANTISTPPKSCAKVSCSVEPTTPTTNFKLLSTVAASLDYLDSDSQSNSSFGTVTVRDSSPSNDSLYIDEKLNKTSRKEKSLTYICNRFLALYPSGPKDNEELFVSVDAIACKLGVERRRMYDIFNVLESIDVVEKAAKNKYKYYGKQNLLPCLRSLFERANALEVGELLESVLKVRYSSRDEAVDVQSKFIQVARKDRTLCAMSKSFLMLFLSAPKGTSISLQTAAQILTANFKAEKTSVQFKTKIRRLYDIANIFISVGLIEKDAKLSKQTFKFIGPNFLDVEASPNPKDGRVLQYLLPNAKVESPLENSQSSKSSFKSTFTRTKSDNWNLPSQSNDRSFIRHSSFHDICTVAEVARKKLFAQQQLHPIKSFDTSSKIYVTPSKRIVTPSKQVVISPKSVDTPSKPVVTKKLLLKFPTQYASNCIQNKSAHKLPHKLPKSSTTVKSDQSSEAGDIELQKASVSPPGSHKLISLTNEQRDKILKCLNVSLESGQVASILISKGKDPLSSLSDNGSKDVSK